MNPTLAIILGLLVRIGIPVGITLLAFYVLHRLDTRWQKEADLLPVIAAGQKPCWEARNCSEEKRKNCAAYANQGTPCWQVFRSGNGALRESCLGCDVFRQAPVPVRS